MVIIIDANQSDMYSVLKVATCKLSVRCIAHAVIVDCSLSDGRYEVK